MDTTKNDGEIIRIKPGPRMSQGVIYGGLLYSAGHVDAQSGDVASQTKNILARLDALLAEAGTDRSKLLSANIWLADMSSFDEMNQVWDKWIDPQNPPVRATVESKLATGDYKVEISIIAVAGR